jgi:hypothetical protein
MPRGMWGGGSVSAGIHALCPAVRMAITHSYIRTAHDQNGIRTTGKRNSGESQFVSLIIHLLGVFLQVQGVACVGTLSLSLMRRNNSASMTTTTDGTARGNKAETGSEVHPGSYPVGNGGVFP